MRTGAIMAAVTATLIAIGVTLGIALVDADPRRLDGFEEIVYTRNVEHGQPRALGTCPLGRDIVVKRTGHVEIVWYVQNPDSHGCTIAAIYEPGKDDKKMWEEPVIARTKFVLGRARLEKMLGELRRLRWTPLWSDTGIEDSASVGCEDRNRNFSDALPSRAFVAVKPGPKIVNLRVRGPAARETATTPCIESELENVATLDAAFDPIAPALPRNYRLDPKIDAQLAR